MVCHWQANHLIDRVFSLCWLTTLVGFFLTAIHDLPKVKRHFLIFLICSLSNFTDEKQKQAECPPIQMEPVDLSVNSRSNSGGRGHLALTDTRRRSRSPESRKRRSSPANGIDLRVNKSGTSAPLFFFYYICWYLFMFPFLDWVEEVEEIKELPVLLKKKEEGDGYKIFWKGTDAIGCLALSYHFELPFPCHFLFSFLSLFLSLKRKIRVYFFSHHSATPVVCCDSDSFLLRLGILYDLFAFGRQSTVRMREAS